MPSATAEHNWQDMPCVSINGMLVRVQITFDTEQSRCIVLDRPPPGTEFYSHHGVAEGSDRPSDTAMLDGSEHYPWDNMSSNNRDIDGDSAAEMFDGRECADFHGTESVGLRILAAHTFFDVLLHDTSQDEMHQYDDLPYISTTHNPRSISALPYLLVIDVCDRFMYTYAFKIVN
ncbi:uncharacterized protein B0H18DRAFT_957070 [Fomitopsis serialis]|uniref:uncharacterized protein n=1 Tax=Fomitopsis serialis TaxID=139415 RepID=UPI0020073FA6|nr:uncharacterized protein B0H18DRAFT_957070 [Neoantrodia serialis]KAH9920487.1 hypothetical protein B0H18DRAFT_957070 [Neoantrodia serialis]